MVRKPRVSKFDKVLTGRVETAAFDKLMQIPEFGSIGEDSKLVRALISHALRSGTSSQEMSSFTSNVDAQRLRLFDAIGLKSVVQDFRRHDFASIIASAKNLYLYAYDFANVLDNAAHAAALSNRIKQRNCTTTIIINTYPPRSTSGDWEIHLINEVAVATFVTRLRKLHASRIRQEKPVSAFNIVTTRDVNGDLPPFALVTDSEAIIGIFAVDQRDETALVWCPVKFTPNAYIRFANLVRARSEYPRSYIFSAELLGTT